MHLGWCCTFTVGVSLLVCQGTRCFWIGFESHRHDISPSCSLISNLLSPHPREGSEEGSVLRLRCSERDFLSLLEAVLGGGPVQSVRERAWGLGHLERFERITPLPSARRPCHLFSGKAGKAGKDDRMRVWKVSSWRTSISRTSASVADPVVKALATGCCSSPGGYSAPSREAAPGIVLSDSCDRCTFRRKLQDVGGGDGDGAEAGGALPAWLLHCFSRRCFHRRLRHRTPKGAGIPEALIGGPARPLPAAHLLTEVCSPFRRVLGDPFAVEMTKAGRSSPRLPGSNALSSSKELVVGRSS